MKYILEDRQQEPSNPQTNANWLTDYWRRYANNHGRTQIIHNCHAQANEEDNVFARDQQPRIDQDNLATHLCAEPKSEHTPQTQCLLGNEFRLRAGLVFKKQTQDNQRHKTNCSPAINSHQVLETSYCATCMPSLCIMQIYCLGWFSFFRCDPRATKWCISPIVQHWELLNVIVHVCAALPGSWDHLYLSRTCAKLWKPVVKQQRCESRCDQQWKER
jgi:hypothetical protein